MTALTEHRERWRETPPRPQPEGVSRLRAGRQKPPQTGPFLPAAGEFLREASAELGNGHARVILWVAADPRPPGWHLSGGAPEGKDMARNLFKPQMGRGCSRKA